MSKYLYGAAVQGIQSFIFQTNELKDIVGASELVENICCKDGLFEEYGKYEDSVLRAAGNIKHIFNSEDECKNAVLNFPKKVMTAAPGITISQAVVKMEGEFTDFDKAVDELETLLRAQRNKSMPSMTVGLMGIKRSNKTGLPAIDIKESKGKLDYIDAAIDAKRQKGNLKGLCEIAFGEEKVNARDVAYNIEDITEKNDWIAIIHADGNGLGQVVQKIGRSETDFKEFSKKLDKATKNSAVAAYRTVVEVLLKEKKRIPVRPIVLGGDDFTVICRADFALEYVSAFMSEFEQQTQTLLGPILRKYNVFEGGIDKLTACAGVAFIKSSYPFYYGYELAENLCSQAKKDAKSYDKNLAPSCVMFHKVQDSFVEDWEKIESRELTTKDGVSFKYGPYYIDKNIGKPTVDELIERVKKLDIEADGNKVKSHLRQWLSALHEDKGAAVQLQKRVYSLLADGKLKPIFAKVTDLSNNKTAAYDMLSLASVKYQDTKTKEEDI